MRIALISDLHGVLEATERVLTDIAQVGVDQIICLGDVTLFGPQPREVLHRVRALGCPVVMGNTDAWALDPQPPAHRDDDSQRYADVEGWGAAMLDEADRDYIISFQPILTWTIDAATRLLLVVGDEEFAARAVQFTEIGAHRGHDDAIAQFEGADATGRKQMGIGSP